jgi:hypothetical protein
MRKVVSTVVLCASVTLAASTPFLRRCEAQTISNWLSAGSSSDWFLPANWSAGVPSLPGDVAAVPGGPGFHPGIGATSASLGRLNFSGGGPVTISGTGTLTFSKPGADPAVISATASQFLSPTIVPALLVPSGETLSLEPGSNSSLTLSGGIGASGGDVKLSGAGQVTLGGGHAGWTGRMTVDAGQLAVTSGTALGSSSEGTVINGGVVTLSAATSEPFTLNGGTLQTTVNFLDLNGPLILPAGNTAVVRGPFDILGGTSGAGDLRLTTQSAAISVRTNPLNHQGGVKITGGTVSFSVDNGYLGLTEVTDGRLDVRTAHGLGSAAAGTTVTRGTLRLHGGSQESVTLTDSTLALWSAEAPLPELRPQGAFTLNNSVLTTYGENFGAANYVVEQPVHLNSGVNTLSTERGRLTLAGGVTGSGRVVFDPSSTYPITLASPVAASVTPELESGSLRVVAAGALTGEILVHSGGRLVVETDQTMERVRTGVLIRPRSPSGFIEVLPGASLTVDRLDMTQGVVLGTVHATGGLHFGGHIGGRTISHLDVETEVHIAAGELGIDDSIVGRAATRAAIHVDRTREASAFVVERSTTEADFYLHNGTGFNYGGALLSENDGDGTPAIVLRGDIHLGDSGAHIGGTDHFRIQGQIDGGDLNLGRLRGTAGLVFEAGTPAYTGATRVYSGEILVSESGRLANTSGVELYPEGALAFDIRPEDGPQTDRFADDVPIRMFGGDLGSRPTDWGVNSGERVGSIQLERGVSSVVGRHMFENSRQAHADLVVGQIDRAPGALLSIISSQLRSGDFLWENRPALVNGLLPAWVIGNTTFTTYDQTGRVKDYEGPLADLATAGANSVARPGLSGTTLTADKTIHALYAYGNTGPIDLGGHTLTVGSGGVSGAVMNNGAVRPGQDAGGEIVFIGGTVINAAIEDNGAPTTVIYAGDAEIGGVNTYTGKTYVIGNPGIETRVQNRQALPTGGDIEISGYATLHLDDMTSGPYQLGNVVIRDGGTFSSACCGQGATVTAESIELEGGRVYLPLAGNVPIAKRTEGVAILGFRSPDFTGQIDVHQGTLQADAETDGYLVFGAGTVNVLPEGRLTLSPVFAPSDAPTPTIKLNGGSLFGVEGVLEDRISLRGNLQVIDDSKIFLLDGRLDRPRTATIRIDGAIQVAAGKSLSVIGRPDLSQGLRVSQGILLAPGAVLAGDGSITARVEIAAGAILSPGELEPGATVGLLATSTPNLTEETGNSRMTWGGGGRYRWEINDAAGDAGAPFGHGWDATRVGVLLDVTATAANPFVIEPIPLGADGAQGAAAGLVPHQSHRWLIAEIGKINAFSATIAGFSAEKFAIDLSKWRETYPQSRASDFWLDIDAQGIHLNAMVIPEPAAGALALLGIAWAANYANPRRRVSA